METSKTPAGELTEKIMAALRKHVSAGYERRCEVVLGILQQYFAEHVEVYNRQQAIELLYDWQYRQGNSFACLLFGLMGKADRLNLHQMRLAWPILVGAWEEWLVQNDEEKWFAEQRAKKI
jgi:hypothetical protein